MFNLFRFSEILPKLNEPSNSTPASFACLALKKVVVVPLELEDDIKLLSIALSTIFPKS